MRHLAPIQVTLSGPGLAIGWLYGYQVDAEVAQPVEQPVQVRLIADLTNQHGLALPLLQHHPIERGLETIIQPPACQLTAGASL